MKTPNEYRLKDGMMASEDSYRNNGCFIIPFRSYEFTVIASDGMNWDHVSVSLPKRCPNWEEMCYIKSLFWEPDECVIQYHPPEEEYVNNHDNCLHMWKPQNVDIPVPDSLLVGYK